MLENNYVAWLGAGLILFGELWALRNINDLRRLLIFSTIGELGYVVLGIGLGNLSSVSGSYLHISLQLIMRLQVIACGVYLIRMNGSTKLDRNAGSGQSYPYVAALFGFGLFSVMGLSPFKGSFSKFLIVYGAIEHGQWLLAIIVTIASIIAAICYLTVIQRVCLEKLTNKQKPKKTSHFFRSLTGIITVALTLLTILVSLHPEPLLHFAVSLAAIPGHDLPHFETPWKNIVLVPYISAFILFVIAQYSRLLCRISALLVGLVSLYMAWQVQGLDALSYVFTLLFVVISLAVVVYSFGYMKNDRHEGRYYFFLFLMLGSLIGVSTSENFGNFYLFWELMTWSSYFLVVHEQTQSALRAGKKYFLMCVSGAYIMHFGILLLHHYTGSFEMTTIAHNIAQLPEPAGLIILTAIVLGLAVKAGVFPLHSWLPDAHPVAPSSISAPMSGILTKAGIYGLAKVIFVIFGAKVLFTPGEPNHYQTILTTTGILGAVTFIYGELFALRETNLKRLLAYSTLAQIGKIVAILAIGSYLSTVSAMMHVTNHAVIKSLMFLAAGAVILRLNSKKLDDLKGVGRQMPITCTCFVIGILSIMGLPPFSGFFSKFLMVYAAVDAGLIILPVLILVGSVIGAIYYIRLIRILFFEPYNGPEISEAPLSMRVVLVLLAALVILGGLFADQTVLFVQPIADLIGGTQSQNLITVPALSLSWSLSVVVAFAGAIIAFFAGRIKQRSAGLVAVMVMVLSLASVLIESARFDLLSFWFAVLIAGVAILNLTYSVGYMKKDKRQNRFFFFFVFMVGGLLGITASPDLFNFFVFWEIMSSWTLYFVIIHEETEDALNQGFKYFIFNFVGASCIFLGVVLLATYADSFDFEVLKQASLSMPRPLFVSAMVLLVAGFLMKSAQLPLRIDFQMHPPTAPTPVSGYISAVLLKSGPYGVLKLIILFAGVNHLSRDMATIMYLVSVIAAFTMLYAGAMAMIQTGVKRLLIYSTVSQLAYVLLGLSLPGTLGVAGGLMHFVNHMMLKNILFLAAGCVLAQLHVHSLDRLGGLGRKMPITFGLFLFAGLSLSGVPPLNGFASKWLIYQAAFQSGHYLLGLSALMSSLFTLAAVLKFAHVAFMGQLTEECRSVKEAPLSMLAPMFVMAALCVLIGIFPGLLLVPVSHIMSSAGLADIQASWLGPLPGEGAWHPLTLTLMLLLSGLMGRGFYKLSNRNCVEIHVHGCGVTDITSDESHVNASSLYESPRHLIQKVFRERPNNEGEHHA